MPVAIDDVQAEVDTPETTGLTETLGPDELRQLAALIYKLMIEELRIERERLGR